MRLRISKFLWVLSTILCVTATVACADKNQGKREAAEKAIAEQNKLQESKKEVAANDTVPPEISFSSDSVNLTVQQTVDYDHIMIGLKAIDNIDGDISNKITRESTNVEEHRSGDYKIKYSVQDSAGNVSEFVLPVHITSKYTKEQESQYFSAISCLNKTTEQLKNPSSANITYITTTEDGNLVHMIFTATNGFGGRTRGQSIYTSDGAFAIDNDGPFNQDNIGVEITYKELIDFDKYYNPDSYVNR